ncbi:MAG: DUF5011 domain-containing protein [Bacteroidota bacterium]|nr:DUF5011 domain-containing protein [Bacteroidota bacterium]
MGKSVFSILHFLLRIMLLFGILVLPFQQIFAQNSLKYIKLSAVKPNSQVQTGIGIYKVKLGDSINNSTKDDDSLTYYNTYSYTVYRGQTLEYNITCGKQYDEQISAWCDWNNDGIFVSSELALSHTLVPAGQLVSGTLIIPCSATLGKHRLRIVSDYVFSNALFVNQSPEYGEAEDYDLTVKTDQIGAISFIKDSLNYVGSVSSFIPVNANTGSIRYEWDWNNDGIIDSTSKIGRYAYTSIGWKKITLYAKVTTCTTTNTLKFTDSVLVGNVPATPITKFIADKNNITTKDVVTLTDISRYRPNRWVWELSPNIHNGIATYSFIGGTSFTTSAVKLTFLQPGKYTITLSTFNARGKGTTLFVKDYIVVAKEYNLNNQLTDTLRTSTGVMSDLGGKATNYSSALPKATNTYKVLISPPCSKGISLKFTQFELNPSFGTGFSNDNIKIWDGVNSRGRSLHDSLGYPNGLTGYSIPDSVYSYSGNMYLEFTVNDIGTAAGFIANWLSNSKTGSIGLSSFSLADTIWYGYKVNAVLTTNAKGYAYEWDVNNDDIIDATGSTSVFSGDFGGKQRVRLVAKDCGGNDTSYRDIFVKLPVAKPKVNFTSSTRFAFVADQISLKDLSTNGTTERQWQISPENYKIVKGSLIDSVLVIFFTDTGSYTISLTASNIIGSDKLTNIKYLNIKKSCVPKVSNYNADLSFNSINITRLDSQLLLQSSLQFSNDSQYKYLQIKPIGMEYGGNYFVKLVRSSNFNSSNISLWADWSGDGDFSDANESLQTLSNSTALSNILNFKVPNVLTYKGVTKLRIAIGNSSLNSCGTNLTATFIDVPIYIQADVIQPIIRLKGKDTIDIELGRKYIDAGATASDNVDGNLSNIISVNNPVNTAQVKVFIISYQVIDVAGNKAITKFRYVRVFPDSTKPIVKLNGLDSVSVSVLTKYNNPGVIVTDNVALNLKASILAPFIDSSKLGWQTLTYRAIDDYGNIGFAYRRVRFIDNTSPILKLVGKDSVLLQINVKYKDAGITITDNYYKTFTLQQTNGVDSSKSGTYKFSYTVTDGSGNKTTISRTVIVRDLTRPILQFNLDTVYHTIKTVFALPNGIIKSDAFDQTSNINLYFKSNLNINTLDKYSVRVFGIDASGNVSDTLRFQVRVIDNIAPNIQLIGNTVEYIDRWKEFDDPGVSVSDNYDKTIRIDTGGNYKNSQVPGIYFREYTARDGSNNRSNTQSRLIIVNESTTNISLAQNSKQLFIVYPNPIVNVTNIYLTGKSFSQFADIGNYKVYDQKGKDISNGTINFNLGQAKFDIQAIPAGTYYLRITLSTHSQVIKIEVLGY